MYFAFQKIANCGPTAASFITIPTDTTNLITFCGAYLVKQINCLQCQANLWQELNLLLAKSLSWE